MPSTDDWQTLADTACAILNNEAFNLPEAVEYSVADTPGSEIKARIQWRDKKHAEAYQLIEKLCQWLDSDFSSQHPTVQTREAPEMKQRLLQIRQGILGRTTPTFVNVVKEFRTKAIRTPIKQYRDLRAISDLWLAAIRIRSVLAFEALTYLEEQEKIANKKARRNMSAYLDDGYRVFHDTQLPSLQELLCQHQIPIDCLETKNNLALMALASFDDMMHRQQRSFLATLSNDSLGTEEYIYKPETITEPVRSLSRGTFLKHLGPKEEPLSSELRLYALLASYWGHLTQMSGISLGLCWNCGEFCTAKTAGGLPMRTCGGRCRTAFHRYSRVNKGKKMVLIDR